MRGMTQRWDFQQPQGWVQGRWKLRWLPWSFLFPRFKKRFVLTRAESEGLQSTVPISHKTPLRRGPARLFAAQGASEGRPRAGVALVIQQAVGLRPSELLRLFPEHIIFQSSLLGPLPVPIMVSVAGTKARIVQVAVI